MKPSPARRALFALLPALAALLLLEGAAAVYRTLRCPGDPPTFAVPDERYGWTHPAGRTVHSYACENSEYA